MSEEYLRQMRELERQEKDLKSQYTDAEKLDVNDYKKLVNATISYAPHTNEKWSEYAIRAKIYANISADKNRLTHIDGPRKAWYTHRNPQGCFMCEDVNLISCLIRVIQEMSDIFPDQEW